MCSSNFVAESRAKEEARAERKASIDSARKMSIESARKMSIDEPQRPDPDLEQIKASVDESRLSVKSAAQKFKEMERKAGKICFLFLDWKHPCLTAVCTFYSCRASENVQPATRTEVRRRHWRIQPRRHCWAFAL